MFAVPKYSQALEQIRRDKGVEGLFQHNLVKVDMRHKVAVFEAEDGGKKRSVEREYDFLHVVPPQKPWDWVAKSSLGEFCCAPATLRERVLTWKLNKKTKKQPTQRDGFR